MLCQVSTSSIRVKLKHQWDQRSGFDCSSPIPMRPSSGGQLLHAAPFHGADKTYCTGDYSLGLYASARTFQGLSESGFALNTMTHQFERRQLIKALFSE